MKQSEIQRILVLLAGAWLSVMVLSLPLGSRESMLFASVYTLFFFGPFLGAGLTLKTDTVETFFLTMILGLSSAAVYVVLDVLLGVPLTSFIFAGVTAVAYVLSWGLYYRQER